MATKRGNEWDRDSEAYSEEQIEAVAVECGIEIDAETNTHFLAYCPFHDNRDSPAFAIDKEKGLWTCFNPSCANSGNLERLVMRTKGFNFYEALRLIKKAKTTAGLSLSDRLSRNREDAERPEFVPFPQEPLSRMKQEFESSEAARAYMHSRGLNDDTLDYFDVGFSSKKEMVIFPMHDPNGTPVGFVGRSIKDKVFKNSTDLPKAKTAWNFHRAKRHGDVLIICESSIDAMRIHQAGYPNVVALLGGYFNDYYKSQISRTFNTVIIATDNDEMRFRPNCRKCPTKNCQGHNAGRELGQSIADSLKNKRIYWATFSDTEIFPHGAKDVGSITDEEIRTVIRNPMSTLQYRRAFDRQTAA